jgi:integrase
MQTKARRRPLRRANGEGSIYQRQDGRWTAALSLPDGRRRVLYGATAAEARDKLLTARASVASGLPLPKERLTLGAWLEAWLTSIAPASVRASTLATYAGYLTKRVLPHRVARLGLVRVGPNDLDGLFRDLRDAGLSPRTIEQIRAIIRHALNVAMKRGLVARNAVTLTDPPRVERREPPALSPEAARSLLDALVGEPRYPLYVVALATGLRLGELLGLRWEDLDLEAGILHVRQAVSRLGGVTRIVPPKTQRSRRQIQVPDSAVAVLSAHRLRKLKLASVLALHGRSQGLYSPTISVRR